MDCGQTGSLDLPGSLLRVKLKESWKIIIEAAKAIKAKTICIPEDDPEMRQSCKICGRPDKFNYKVSNQIWCAVVPAKFRNLVVCLYCFDELARQKNIDYAQSLKSLCFAGDKACFQFQVLRASELRIKNSCGRVPSPCTHCKVRRSWAWYIVPHNSR